MEGAGRRWTGRGGRPRLKSRVLLLVVDLLICSTVVRLFDFAFSWLDFFWLFTAFALVASAGKPETGNVGGGGGGLLIFGVIFFPCCFFFPLSLILGQVKPPHGLSRRWTTPFLFGRVGGMVTDGRAAFVCVRADS